LGGLDWFARPKPRSKTTDTETGTSSTIEK
jgi:hypothetical protein